MRIPYNSNAFATAAACSRSLSARSAACSLGR
jgi:hypothetical protein